MLAVTLACADYSKALQMCAGAFLDTFHDNHEGCHAVGGRLLEAAKRVGSVALGPADGHIEDSKVLPMCTDTQWLNFDKQVTRMSIFQYGNTSGVQSCFAGRQHVL